MIRFLFVMALLLLSTSGWCQFYETPEEVPEESIYPSQNYETEMGTIQEEQDLLYPPTETPVDQYSEQNNELYDVVEPTYDEE